ncbi:tRNA (guanine-N(7)-)-methyltransferase [Isosphaera pallida ATCC 43644]|uniref:tRNA (guanine-N(7)-)-methyltransferase n=1 Tax=Isosphaera pallida (strain ATCC 43644 / DSM 9630 / IS1B) TaxID=575540 RepID=E8R2G4_ISOPI|nr:tRNA (guanosine(46)-N7)-methyltransferase TrmB [Isosphaera pallida]ADV61449.1 tRNA (guanine-N(7)-)-methyltransferase [Isosphaera pallida ATCC 43644]
MLEPKPRTSLDLTPYTFDYDPRHDPPIASWADVFGAESPDRPVELEVGCGKGLFLANESTRRPDVRFLGVEISKKYALRARERMAKHRLSQVRILAGDAVALLGRCLPPRCLQAVHIYFPDPWWKKKHRKRRIFTPWFVGRVAELLQPEGQLRFASDVADYFAVMMALTAASGRFDPLPTPPETIPQHDLDYLTNFERKFRIEGRPIQRAAWQVRNPEYWTEPRPIDQSEIEKAWRNPAAERTAKSTNLDLEVAQGVEGSE